MNRAVTMIAAAAGAAWIVLACSPDPGPFFTPADSPDNPSAFRRGKLGLITPALDKTWELLAFRSLTGLPPVNAAGGVDSAPAVAADASGPPTFQWGNARHEIALPLPPLGYPNPYKLGGQGANVYYLNCLDDAFLTAVRTLRDRRRNYGDDSAFQAWVAAQDQVFRNCSEKDPVYPAAPPANAAPRVSADRRYQIAAAHFYAEDFDGAEKLFRAIAVDSASPWRDVGAYMVGRTLLRAASLSHKQGAAVAARAQFVRVADSSSSGPLRDSAKGLIEHLTAIQHAPETLRKLAAALIAPAPGADFGKTLETSRYVLLADSYHAVVSQPGIPEPFDWVRTLEAEDEASAAHAVERWQARHSLPWLTLALIHSSGKDAAAPDLIEAAGRVPADSPGYITVSYNQIRLRLERGETDEPRALLNRILEHETAQPREARNALRAERMRLATSFDGFLRWAPRMPVSFAAPSDAWPVLAEDAAYVLNYDTPLSMLVTAAHSPRLPEWSAANVAVAAWTRAFMLGNREVMADMAPLLAKAYPAWSGELSGEAKRSAAEARFHEALLIARNDVFTPVVPVDYRKPQRWMRWWCAVEQPRSWATERTLAGHGRLAITGDLRACGRRDLAGAKASGCEGGRGTRRPWLGAVRRGPHHSGVGRIAPRRSARARGAPSSRQSGALRLRFRS